MSVSLNRIETRKRYSTLVSILAGAFIIFRALPIFSEYAREVIQAKSSGKNDLHEEGVDSVDRWDIFESKYFTIYHHPDANLRAIERRLKKRAFYFGRETLSGDASIEDKIGYRLDYLFKRAREILDMYPKMGKIKIKILTDRRQLRDEYYKIFGYQEEMKSFYVHKYETLYISEDDISDSIVVHEIAHAIIDSYFEVVPPKKLAEVMASYVDSHLEE